MFGLGTGELVIIAIILFLLFGAKRLPDIGKGLGGAIREFRKVKKDLSLKEEPKTAQQQTSLLQDKEKTIQDKSRDETAHKSSGDKNPG